MGKVLISFVLLIYLGGALKLGTSQHTRLGSINWSIQQFTQFINRQPSSKPVNNHTQDRGLPSSTYNKRTSTPETPYPGTQLDPHQRLFKWAQENPALNKSMSQDVEFTGEQQKLVVQFMVNDTYFQQELIGQLKQDKNNSWINELPPKAQIRYLKIIATLNYENVGELKNIEKVEEKLLDDYDIQPVFRNFRQAHPQATSIQTACKILTYNSM